MRNFKTIFFLVIICSVCFVSCAKNGNNGNNEVNNNNSIEQQTNIKQNISKEKLTFSSDNTNVKFEYSSEFTISNTEEVKEQLSQNNIEISDEKLKGILKSSENEVIVISEETNEMTLEQLKEKYNQLSKYEEFEISIEKNEIVKVDNQDVLCVIMEVQQNKMQIITVVSNEKTVTIQYISNVDDFDYENAQIILNSVNI